MSLESMGGQSESVDRRSFLVQAGKVGVVGASAPLMFTMLGGTAAAEGTLSSAKTAFRLACPVPGSGHGPIPEGSSRVGTVMNVIQHLAEQDRPYLEARCHQILADLGIDPNPIPPPVR